MTYLVANLNDLSKHARGNLVATVAGDEYWLFDRLIAHVPVYQEDDVNLSYYRLAVFGERGILYDYPPLPKVRTFTEVLNWLLTIFACIKPVSVIIDGLDLERISGFYQYENYPVEDYPTYLKVCYAPCKVRPATLTRSLAIGA